MKKQNKDNQKEEKSLNRRGFLGGTTALLGGLSLRSTKAQRTKENSSQGDQNKKEFHGKVAFITGGARGIGLATAIELAKAGSNIVLFDVAKNIKGIHYNLATESQLNEAKKKVESLGVKCLSIKGDVRDINQLRAAYKKTIDQFQTIDFLFANAGVIQAGKIEDLKDFEIDLITDINLKGLIKTVQAAIPYLKKQRSGRIILNASIAGRMASSNLSLYSTTKFGVIGFCKNVAQELGEYNITCNTVCPSFVDTEILTNSYVLKEMFPYAPVAETWNQIARRLFHKLPVGMHKPEVIAHTVKFLCSDGAKYTSGDIFDVQAGANSMTPA